MLDIKIQQSANLSKVGIILLRLSVSGAFICHEIGLHRTKLHYVSSIYCIIVFRKVFCRPVLTAMSTICSVRPSMFQSVTAASSIVVSDGVIPFWL